MTLKIPFWVVAIIAVVVMAFIFFHGCRKSLEPEQAKPEVLRTEVHHHWDTTIHLVHTHQIHYKPVEGKPEFEIIPETADTQKDFTAYYTPVEFMDSVKSDSLEGVYSGIIWAGGIYYPKFTHRFTFPTSTTNNTFQTAISPQNRSLSLGAFLGYSDAPILGGMAVYRDRRDRSFLVGYGLNQTMIFGVSGKITLKRR